MAVEIILGLKKRSKKYLLNSGVYTKKDFPLGRLAFEHHLLLPQFEEGMTWFEDRLWHDQAVDARQGRFLYDDQHPVLFSRDQLPKSVVSRDPKRKEVVPVDIDIGDRVVALYRNLLPKICRPGEDKDTYGETVLQDSINIRILYERICGVGPYVAQAKINQDLSLLDKTLTDDQIVEMLRNKKREDEVVEKAVYIAVLQGLIDEKHEPLVRPETIEAFFRDIIKITTDVELAYIRYIQKNNPQKETKDVKTIRPEYPRTSPGWGQEPRKQGNGSKGWGST